MRRQEKSATQGTGSSMYSLKVRQGRPTIQGWRHLFVACGAPRCFARGKNRLPVRRCGLEVAPSAPGPPSNPPYFSPVPERACPRRRRNLPGAAAARLGQQVAVLPSCAQRRHIERQKKTSHRGRAVRVFFGGRSRSGLAPAGRPAKPARAARRRLFALARAAASLRCVAHRSPLSSRFVCANRSRAGRESAHDLRSNQCRQTI